MTFHADRTVSGQAVGPGSTNAYGAGELGLWSPKEHGRGFTFRLLSYNYNDNGGITGSTEINATAELTSANTFAYKTKSELLRRRGQACCFRVVARRPVCAFDLIFPETRAAVDAAALVRAT